jgi:hypothetical protein
MAAGATAEALERAEREIEHLKEEAVEQQKVIDQVS